MNLPGRRATPLGRWSEIVPAQDIADSLIRDGMAQIGQGTHDAVIAPAPIFARKADHELLDFG